MIRRAYGAALLARLSVTHGIGYGPFFDESIQPDPNRYQEGIEAPRCDLSVGFLCGKLLRNHLGLDSPPGTIQYRRPVLRNSTISNCCYIWRCVRLDTMDLGQYRSPYWRIRVLSSILHPMAADPSKTFDLGLYRSVLLVYPRLLSTVSSVHDNTDIGVTTK